MLLVVDPGFIFFFFLLLQLFKKVKGAEMCTRQHHLCCPLPCKDGSSWVGLVNPENRFCSNSLCCWLGLGFGFAPSGWFWLADFTTCSFK